MKYVNLLLVVALTAGQVQYAYESYYCTMMHAAVSSASMNFVPSDDQNGSGGCGECASEVKSYAGLQTIDAGCVQVTTSQKGVVDSFVGPTDRSFHSLLSSAVLPAHSLIQPLLPFVGCVVGRSDSPPPDLPTLNSTLRI